MLLDFILLVAVGVLGYLFYTQNAELKQLQKYSANLETELLHKQIKMEELDKQTKLMDNNGLLNTTDTITGLPSPQVFHDRALQTFNMNKRAGGFFGILFLDVQGFETISQKLGVEKTSVLLNEIAKRLNSSIRQVDTLTRYGDAVFLILLPQLAQPVTAAYVAQRVIGKFEEPFYINDRPIILSVNIGISVYPEDGDSLTSLIERGENALKKAKESQTPYLFSSQELQRINDLEIKIAKILQAPDLENKIVIYCLPQVNALTNKIIGIKAIPYIKDETLGLLAYDRYVKIAERENKLNLIVSHLLAKVIPQFSKWQMNGLSPDRLAINISSKQIQNEEFINLISTIVLQNDFDSRLLAFEINAENFSQNASSVQEAFTRLKNLGVQLSIGVFSLGHLAIQKITQLPVTYLKIDERLIRALQYSENEMLLVALMDLSQNMGLATVAEGVDEEGQKSILQKLGFEVMQGKLFGEAQPMELFLR